MNSYEGLRASCAQLESVRPGYVVRVEVLNERGEVVEVIDFRFDAPALTSSSVA